MNQLSDTSLGPGFKLHQWYLVLFGVVPNHQGKGYGKAIMAAVEKLVSVQGCSNRKSETNASPGKSGWRFDRPGDNQRP
jgi:GNAT superfamily N-acetyltransferase